MHYPIPESPEEVAALRQNPIDEELVATAIAGVVAIARAQGQSLDELTAEVLHDDCLLSTSQRRQLSQLVARTWQRLASDSATSSSQ